MLSCEYIEDFKWESFLFVSFNWKNIIFSVTQNKVHPSSLEKMLPQDDHSRTYATLIHKLILVCLQYWCEIPTLPNDA